MNYLVKKYYKDSSVEDTEWWVGTEVSWSPVHSRKTKWERECWRGEQGMRLTGGQGPQKQGECSKYLATWKGTDPAGQKGDWLPTTWCGRTSTTGWLSAQQKRPRRTSYEFQTWYAHQKAVQSFQQGTSGSNMSCKHFLGRTIYRRWIQLTQEHLPHTCTAVFSALRWTTEMEVADPGDLSIDS